MSGARRAESGDFLVWNRVRSVVRKGSRNHLFRTAAVKLDQSTGSIVTVSGLRSETLEVVETAEASREAMLVVNNNEPYAVLVSFDHSMSLMDGSQ